VARGLGRHCTGGVRRHAESWSEEGRRSAAAEGGYAKTAFVLLTGGITRSKADRERTI